MVNKVEHIKHYRINRKDGSKKSGSTASKMPKMYLTKFHVHIYCLTILALDLKP